MDEVRAAEDKFTEAFEGKVAELCKEVAAYIFDEFGARKSDDTAEFMCIWLSNRIIAHILYEIREATYQEEEEKGIFLSGPRDRTYEISSRTGEFISEKLKEMARGLDKEIGAEELWYKVILEALRILGSVFRTRKEGPFLVKNATINGLRFLNSRQELFLEENVDDTISEASIPFF